MRVSEACVSVLMLVMLATAGLACGGSDDSKDATTTQDTTTTQDVSVTSDVTQQQDTSVSVDMHQHDTTSVSSDVTQSGTCPDEFSTKTGCGPNNVTDKTGDGATVTVNMTANLTFDPKCVRVKVGQKIKFDNPGGFSLHPLKESCGPTTGKFNKSGTDTSFEVTVTADMKGLWGLFCENHGASNGAGMAMMLQVVE